MILLRVVCGLGETIEIFSPISWFSRVDFPAFGRPRMETVPHFCVVCISFIENRSSGYLKWSEMPDRCGIKDRRGFGCYLRMLALCRILS